MASAFQGDDDELVPFAHLRLVGGRFERPGLPLETAHELERYARIVLEVAKALWKERHPGRNLPAGFAQELGLRLREVRSGSVIPVITRSETILPIDAADILAEARDAVDEAFERIVAGDWEAVRLPQRALRPLRRFGASFGPREALLLRADGTRAPIRWDQSARRRHLARSEGATVEIDGVIVGTVRALDSAEQTFRITRPGHLIPITGHFADRTLFDDLLAATRPEDDYLVRLTARYRMTSEGDVLEVVDVRDVEPFLSLDAPGGRRLAELAGLAPGWLDGQSGEPVDLSAIEFAREVLMRVGELGLAFPRIYPTPEGGVQLEWHGTVRHVELTVSPDLGFEVFRLEADGVEDLESGRGADTAVDVLEAVLEAVSD